jgi:hypothetical protein
MRWVFEQEGLDWNELSNLYRIAPLGEKKPEHLKVVFSLTAMAIFENEARAVGTGLVDGT